MFAPLSRRGSRVRTAYTCLSCLGHRESRLTPLLIDHSTRTTLAPFTTASSNTQNVRDENHDEVAATAEPKDLKDEKTGEAPEKVSFGTTNETLPRRRRSRRKPPQFRISNSRDALAALRASLLAEDSLLATKKKGSAGEAARSAEPREKKGKRALRSSKLQNAVEEETSATSKRLKTAKENTIEKNLDGLSSEQLDAVPSKAVKSRKKISKEPPLQSSELTTRTKALSAKSSRIEVPKLPAKKKKISTAKTLETAKSEDVKKSKTGKSKTGEKISKSAAVETTVTGGPLKISKIIVAPDEERFAKAAHIARLLSSGEDVYYSNPEFTLNEKFLRAQRTLVRGISHYAQRSASMESSLRDLVRAGVLSPEDMAPALEVLRPSLVRRLDSSSMTTTASKELKDSLQHKRFERRPAQAVKPPARRREGAMAKVEKNGSKMAGPVKAIRGMVAQEIESIDSSTLALTPLEKGPLQVPSLSYGLERVLFNPGVYELQDPRSRTFNFDHYLQTIMPVSEFDFNALKEYITSSRDMTLLSAARAEKKKYTGSTSSMTAALAHFHFLLSQWRPVNTGTLSKDFPVPYNTFTALQRGPVAIFLRWRNGTYAIDADKQFDTANILSMLGKSMEKLLTLPKEGFERYRKPNSDQISEEERNEDEAFHYTTMGDFLMRSQLDAYDPKLPGTGMFDLKTRAVVSIRMDASQYKEGRGYEILGRHGEYESYEREYYDMIRAAFLKYSLQVRMGRMDGIFVAFHNTERIFGFQYISISEMDYALHGTDDVTTGDSEFKLSLDLLNRVLDRATAKYPEKSLRLHFETRDADPAFMYIFAEPFEEKQIEEIQSTNKAEIAEFESKVLGLVKEEESEDLSKAEWDVLRARVEETMEQDEMGPEAAEDDVSEDDHEDSKMWDKHDGEQADDIWYAAGRESEVEEDEDGEEDDDDSEDEDEDEDGDGDNMEDETAIEEKEENLGEGEDEVEGNEADSLEDDDVEQERDKVEQLEASQLDENEKHLEEAEINEDGTNATDAETTEAILSGDQTPEGGKEPEVIELDGTDTSNHADEAKLSEFAAIRPEDHKSDSESPIFCMTLTIRNKVNGAYVDRPNNLSPKDKWVVEYALAEVPNTDRAEALYNATKARRAKVLSRSRSSNASNAWNENYINNLKKLSKKGREWRQRRDEEEKDMPVKTLNIEEHKLDGYNKESNIVEGKAEKKDE